MAWSFPIARIFGTQLRIHFTFFFLIAGFSVWGYREAEVWGALFAALFVMALFTCVVLHELGHALAGRLFGIHTPDITLLPIGGLARLERIPSSPWQEFVIAIAGPAVNVAIASTIAITLVLVPGFGEMPGGFPPLSFPQFVIFLFSANISLIVFNMIPAFPMDGGRVFRALLATVMSHARATSIAAGLGQILAIAGGLWAFSNHEPRYYPLFFITIFIFIAAGREASAAKLRASIEGIPVSKAMVRNFETVLPGTSLEDAARALVYGSQSDFPVVDEGGVFVGMLSRNEIINGMRKHNCDDPVSLVMKDASRPVLDTLNVENALEILNVNGGPFLPVVEVSRGPLVGLFSSRSLGQMLEVRTAMPGR